MLVSGGTGALEYSLSASNKLYIDEDTGYVYAFTSAVNTVEELCTVTGCSATVGIKDTAGTSKEIQVRAMELTTLD